MGTPTLCRILTNNPPLIPRHTHTQHTTHTPCRCALRQDEATCPTSWRVPGAIVATRALAALVVARPCFRVDGLPKLSSLTSLTLACSKDRVPSQLSGLVALRELRLGLGGCGSKGLAPLTQLAALTYCEVRWAGRLWWEGGRGTRCVCARPRLRRPNRPPQLPATLLTHSPNLTSCAHFPLPARCPAVTTSNAPTLPPSLSHTMTPAPPHPKCPPQVSHCNYEHRTEAEYDNLKEGYGSMRCHVPSGLLGLPQLQASSGWVGGCPHQAWTGVGPEVA